jgi:abortive infection bacteriophage resistance protein
LNFNKLPIEISQQIAILKQRGLAFADEKKAAHYLSNISYYRLRAYTYPFQDNSNPNHPFKTKISFEESIDLYVFGRRLRLLVFDALEKVEIALRTKIIYVFALNHGSHWHEEMSLYRKANRFIRDISKLYEEVDRSTETFIKHYKNTYTQPTNPPAWMSLEVTSMGLLSKLYENLKKGPEKKLITESFGLTNPIILESWMHAFAHLRNICAHHGRLWNRRLTTMPQIPHQTIYPFVQNKIFYNNKLYSVLCCITYILHIISPANTFNERLHTLMDGCALNDLKEMGFPSNWKTEVIWKP